MHEEHRGIIMVDMSVLYMIKLLLIIMCIIRLSYSTLPSEFNIASGRYQAFSSDIHLSLMLERLSLRAGDNIDDDFSSSINKIMKNDLFKKMSGLSLGFIMPFSLVAAMSRYICKVLNHIYKISTECKIIRKGYCEVNIFNDNIKNIKEA
jgi:hypothetical protein